MDGFRHPSGRREKGAGDPRYIRDDINRAVRSAALELERRRTGSRTQFLAGSNFGGTEGVPQDPVFFDQIPVSDEDDTDAKTYSDERFGNVGAVIDLSGGDVSVERAELIAMGGMGLEDDEAGDKIRIVYSAVNDPILAMLASC